jgi:flagellar basal-body rod protein FlgB
MIDRFAQSLRFQTVAMELRSARQALIAGNIANADTPGYRAVDADFSTALQRATADTTPGRAAPAKLLPAEIVSLPATQAARDGNTVDMDAERARFTENAVRYEAALKALNHQVKSLLAVISA